MHALHCIAQHSRGYVPMYMLHLCACISVCAMAHLEDASARYCVATLSSMYLTACQPQCNKCGKWQIVSGVGVFAPHLLLKIVGNKMELVQRLHAAYW